MQTVSSWDVQKGPGVVFGHRPGRDRVPSDLARKEGNGELERRPEKPEVDLGGG